MADVRLERVTKTFGNVGAARDVSLHVQEELLVLVGPSGLATHEHLH